MIEFDRRYYTHVGMFMGDGEIVHYTDKVGNSVSPKGATIYVRQQPLNEVANGMILVINR